MRALDVISALSALGALPPFLNAAKQYARYAQRWLQTARPRLARNVWGANSQIISPGAIREQSCTAGHPW
jgi:hypothetical protein